jgi:signal transduction histidine kinase
MSRFYSIRFRLTAYFLAIILAVMIIISFFLYSNLERYYMSNYTDSLERSAYLAADFVAGQLRGQVDSVRLSNLAENMSQQSQTRVIFTDSQGLVVGDSLRIGGLLNQNLEQEDLERALQGETSYSITYSDAVANDIIQMAIPVTDSEGAINGAVFLSASLEEIYHILYDIRRYLFLATLLAMTVVGSGSVILARRFTGPLEALTQATKKMAEGNLDQHIEVMSGDEIGRLAEQFNIMARKLGYYTGNLKKFAADVAHEVRTPLTTMTLLTKALKEHEMEPEQRKDFLNDLDSELERLIALVNDLLALSRLEKTTIEFEDVDLKLFLRDAISENQYRYARVGLELLDNLQDQHLMVKAVPLQLRQVVSNLLDNAYNYTPAGGTVTVSLAKDGNEAIITVEDTGCGIPAEDLDYIFERFFRVDRARSREGGGTGLGLAIVSEIIAKHGGRVWVESEEASGSRFMVALPLAQEANVSKS